MVSAASCMYAVGSRNNGDVCDAWSEVCDVRSTVGTMHIMYSMWDVSRHGEKRCYGHGYTCVPQKKEM